MVGLRPSTLTNFLIKPYRRFTKSLGRVPGSEPLASSFKISALFNQNIPHWPRPASPGRGHKLYSSIFWPFELERVGFYIGSLNRSAPNFIGFHERTLTLLCSLDFSSAVGRDQESRPKQPPSLRTRILH